MSKFDFIILGFLAFTAFVGFIRGFITELFEAGAIILAIILGRSLGLKLGPLLPGSLPDYMRVPLSTFVLSILIVFIVKAIGNLISKPVKKGPLKPVNTFLGGIMGAGKGMVLIILLLAIMSFTPAARLLNQIKGPTPILSWAQKMSKPIIQNYGGKVADATTQQLQALSKPVPSIDTPITAEERAKMKKLLQDPTIRNLKLSEQELRQLAAKMDDTHPEPAKGR